MIKCAFLALCLFSIFACSVSGQTIQLTSDTTLFTIRQESIPDAPDSGGKWIPLTIVITSNSQYPVHIPGFQTHLRDQIGNSGCSPIRVAKLADSAYLIADSILIREDVLIGNTLHPDAVVAHGTPWKYKDSVLSLWLPEVDTIGFSFQHIDGNPYHGIADLEFIVPPHGTLRVPYLVQAIGTENTHQLDFGYFIFDVQQRAGIEYWFSDSTSPGGIIRRMGDSGEYEFRPYPFWLSTIVPAPCSGPAILFDTTTLTNNAYPVILGGPAYKWSKYVWAPFAATPNDTVFQTTMVSFKIVGEYSDRFVPPAGTTLRCSDAMGLNLLFNGAPKPIAHDTLISTSTDCWGTVVTRTPIEAYTTIKGGYKVRGLQTNTAPFLGSTSDTVVVSNVSDFPIELKNLQISAYSNDPESFQIVAAPSVIAAHDSGYVIALLTDNDNAKDTANDYRGAYLTGIVNPYQLDMAFSDSAFLCRVDGKVDVWCPVNTIYTGEKSPEIKHGTHPRGIIFPSDISSTITGSESFEIRFGNFDSVSEYFYSPYFDDPHFQIAIGNFDGFGTLPVPGLIPPATFSSQICAKISYSGDGNQNYLTQLHWPRANDTVTIDVMVIGVDAPPFSGIARPSVSRSFSLWPNPASTMVHMRCDVENATVMMYDLLGRRVFTSDLSQHSPFDISGLPGGIYSVVLNSKDGSTATQTLSIVR